MIDTRRHTLRTRLLYTRYVAVLEVDKIVI